MTTVSGETVDLADVQGNILRGYRKARVRHLVLQVIDAPRARAWIKATVESDRLVAPAITRTAHWGERPPDFCFNLGVTFAGMTALGVPPAAAKAFPQAYREGMAARAIKLGDWGPSAPEHWHPWFRAADAVHVIATLHANTVSLLDDGERLLRSGLGAQAFRIVGGDEGFRFDGDAVHFGYRDNISEPRFGGLHAAEKYDDQPLAPLGTVLLGYRTAFEQVTWTLPNPPVLGLNGAFNAYRVLEQDVAGFEAFLDQAAEQLLASPAADELLPPQHLDAFANRRSAMRELVAAKMCGRWRTGTPLALSPRDAAPQPPVSDTDYDYVADGDGLKCPLGAHTRRTNPRGGKIVQRIANHTRRLVRRGIPDGPQFDPNKPDTIERGLLGNFICADLSAQFEAIQYRLDQSWFAGSADNRLERSAARRERGEYQLVRPADQPGGHPVTGVAALRSHARRRLHLLS